MRRFKLPISMIAMLALLSLAYAGCKQGELIMSDALVSSVTVSPKTLSLSPGRTAQLDGRALDNSGAPVTATLGWESSAPSVATVSNSGTVTAVGVGTTQITASAGAISDVAAVTVSPAPVASVVISPASPSVTVNQTTQLTATTRDAAGATLSGRVVTWETSAANIATVSANGLVRGVAAGSATITARSEGQAGSVSVSVMVAPVATVTLTPATPTIMVGSTVQMVPVLRDATGAELSGRAVTYETSAGGVATVSSTGLVTGVSVGTTTITARSEGQSGSTVVTVQATPPAPVATVTVAPTNPTIIIAGTVQLAATLRAANGTVLTGRAVTWETSAGGVATVSASGLVRGVTAGTTTITARSEGQAGSTTVTVQLPPVATITVAPGTSSIAINGTVQLAATLRDAGGAVLTGRTVTWETSAAGNVTVNASGLATGVAAGSATITARSEGQAGSAVVTVQPAIAPVATVTLSPATSTISINATQQLTATLRDAAGNTLTGRTVTWETSAAGTATVSATGLVTGVAAGNATITARSEGQAGSAVVTVQAAVVPVATITLAPATSTINVNATQQLTATLRDAAGNTLTGRTVTWETSAAGTATVSATGLVRGVAAGSVTITARSEGQAGTASVTVQLPPVATIAVAPATNTILVNGTAQLTATLRDAGGNTLTGRTVTWETSAAGVATVSTSGLVTGVAAGNATITARSEGQAGTAAVTVQSPPPPGANPDPTLLPKATGQHPAAFTYGRALSAGQKYLDPITGVTVMKLTDASTPASNSGMYHGYSEGGPNISLPWTGTDGQTYYTAKVGDYLVDIRDATFTPLNWRPISYWGEIGFAFSLNPATPRIAYVVNGRQINRYNTATNAIENTGGWPWVPAAAGDYPVWLQTQINDTWVLAMLQSNTTIIARRTSDRLERAVTPALAGLDIDEPHLDREFPNLYITTVSSPIKNKIYNLETGVFTNPDNPNQMMQDSHGAVLRGKVVAQGHWQANAIMETTRFGAVRPVVSPTPTDVNGDYHFAGQWVFNNPNEYFVLDQWAGNGAYAIYRGMIGFASTNGDVRLFVAHDATGTSYTNGGQPHPTLAPDGKFVMWNSNMNGSSRYDTFIARVPLR